MRHSHHRGLTGALQRQRGLATVEMTLVLPVLLFLVLATAELGHAFIQYNALTRAVRDGARYLSERALNGQTGVLQLKATDMVATRNLVVYGNAGGTGQPTLRGLNTNQVLIVTMANNNFTVQVNYPYTPMIAPAIPGLLGTTIATTFTMQAAVAMRAI